MSTRRPPSPDGHHLPYGDSDSDLDLDLQELDPVTSERLSRPSSTPTQHRRSRRAEQARKGRIALRNLRPSASRNTSARARDYGAQSSPDDEDLEGLLNDDDAEFDRKSGGRRSAGASLDTGRQGSGSTWKRGLRSGKKFGGLGSTLQLPSFGMPSSPSRSLLPVAQEEHDTNSARFISIGSRQTAKYPPNAISNAKYTPWSFLPLTLYNEFKFFFNLYFLLVALSQLIPQLRIGYLSTYVAPLAFVLAVTLGKEAVDDIARRRRDAEANAEGYTVLICDKNDSRLNSRRYRKRSKSTAQSTKPRYTSLPVHEAATNGQLGTDHANDLVERDQDSDVVEIVKKARDLKVGDIVRLGKDQRVPADLVILKTETNETAVALAPKLSNADNLFEGGEHQSEEVEQTKPPADAAGQAEDQKSAGGAGETFIKTDQLDGETDWKLRLAAPLTQNLPMAEFTKLRLSASKPDKNVNNFTGSLELDVPVTDASFAIEDGEDEDHTEASQPVPERITRVPLNIDNTAWANTVIASNSSVIAVVVYTGRQTRQALSTSPSRSKTGLLENEINALTKILCALTLSISIVLVGLEGFESTPDRKWYIAILQFLILFSTIIPISLRVNLDMGKTVYAWFIEKDQGIRGALVRTSTIPEELGRIEYLLSDKTGTLTQNEMELKKIHVGTVSYANESMDEVGSYIRQGFSNTKSDAAQSSVLVTPSFNYQSATSTNATRSRREIGSRVRDVVLAMALCHNVTPTSETIDGKNVTSYQASSPDEIAIVRWTEDVGLKLIHRDRSSMLLQSKDTSRVVVKVRILDVFPFTSEGKRMGIIVQFLRDLNSPPGLESGDESSTDIWFYQKGADTVMTSIVAANDWLDEETANMAREGLRTLVVGRRKLSTQQYQDFKSAYREASLALYGRDTGMAQVVAQHLERNLELLGVTGVEDRLQQDVKPSLELLRNAGIKIWMLTGDKVETARCVAISAKLVARGQYIHTIAKLKRKDAAQDSIDFLHSKTDACLLIDGESLALFLDNFREAFISVAVQLPTVVACRCSPIQKAEVAKLIRAYTRKRVCCIGDGGNDVSMIQAADVGVGIVGKEGRQASLAADFSIEQFNHLTKLLVWHGRNSYKRSAKLAQFVIHRGLIISVCQTMYSIASKFEPNALYKDWLLVGYATIYTMFPVFSLVLDKDVDEDLAALYPELYKELTLGRSLSYQTFFVWVLVSIYQGGIIQGLSQILVEVDGKKMVAVSFTVLVINELIMVAFEITTWHPVMIFTLIGTAMIYFGSVPFLGRYFDLGFVLTVGFLWRVLAISAVSLIPPYAAKLLRRTLKPPSYRKVQAF